MITFSRNKPIALIFTKNSFLSVNLANALLERGIQTIFAGVEVNQKQGQLSQAGIENNSLLYLPSDEITDQLPRLDYVIFDLKNFSKAVSEKALNYLSKFVSYKQVKTLFISSINLYDTSFTKELDTLKDSENLYIELAEKNKINARVLRLSFVYGPGMSFEDSDPLDRLLEASFKKELMEESVPLDYMTRAVYINDAVDLCLKTLLHSGTAGKSYDGALLHPIRISELKQVLLNLPWYEKVGFTPTLLAAWPTPNLVRTENELNWHISSKIVPSLRQTLDSFQTRVEKKAVTLRPLKQVKSESETVIMDVEQQAKKTLRNLENEILDFPILSGIETQGFGGKRAKGGSKFFSILILLIFLYFFVYPINSFFYQYIKLPETIQLTLSDIKEGSFKNTQTQMIGEDTLNITAVGISYWLNNIKLQNGYTKELEKRVDSLNSKLLIEKAATDLVRGGILEQGKGDGNRYETARQHYIQAKNGFYFAKQIGSSDADDLYSISSWKAEQALFESRLFQVNNSRVLIALSDTRQSSLPLGEILGIGEADFDQDGLTGLHLLSASEFDSSLQREITVPNQFKDQIASSNWSIKDALVDEDAQTDAEWLNWFYQKKTKGRVDGVVIMDRKALQDLIKLEGEIEVNGKTVDETSIASLDNKDTLTAAGLLIQGFLKIPPEEAKMLPIITSNLEQQKKLYMFSSDPILSSLLSSN